MSYLSNDEQLLIKIQKYMKILKNLYNSIENLKAADLEESVEAVETLALSQCMTNLFALSSKISNDAVAEKIVLLTSGRVTGFGNIAAYDDDSICWDIAKKNVRLILSTITENCIKKCFDLLQNKTP